MGEMSKQMTSLLSHLLESRLTTPWSPSDPCPPEDLLGDGAEETPCSPQKTNLSGPEGDLWRGASALKGSTNTIYFFHTNCQHWQ